MVSLLFVLRLYYQFFEQFYLYQKQINLLLVVLLKITMKIQFEELGINDANSFRINFDIRMNDFFFWHFHPEYELVYIEGASATRHIGEHISKFEQSDLVFIGSYIPHLNFDYGVKTSYEKIVIHLNPHFLGNALTQMMEFEAIHQLFERSKQGIAFGEVTKNMVGERLKQLRSLTGFDQLLEMLAIFQLLANTPDFMLLHNKPVENQYSKKEQERLQRLYRFIDENYQRKISIEEVADLSNLTETAFCRYFKKMTRLTFTEFMNHYRVNQAKKLLLLDKTVTETCFECGFESLSYFNRTFKKTTNENPLSFKKRHR